MRPSFRNWIAIRTFVSLVSPRIRCLFNRPSPSPYSLFPLSTIGLLFVISFLPLAWPSPYPVVHRFCISSAGRIGLTLFDVRSQAPPDSGHLQRSCFRHTPKLLPSARVEGAQYDPGTHERKQKTKLRQLGGVSLLYGREVAWRRGCAMDGDEPRSQGEGGDGEMKGVGSGEAAGPNEERFGIRGSKRITVSCHPPCHPIGTIFASVISLWLGYSCNFLRPSFRLGLLTLTSIDRGALVLHALGFQCSSFSVAIPLYVTTSVQFELTSYFITEADIYDLLDSLSSPLSALLLVLPVAIRRHTFTRPPGGAVFRFSPFLFLDPLRITYPLVLKIRIFYLF
ncbi:hypothetical protein NMY22_g12399 [Coprinellus aureogranulatus]|nr:hypothetical protein NMY22_g12399 [Coprinellus aureogranulatus]